MLTDTSLQDAVMDRIGSDPRIPDAPEIAVSAHEGIVTLRGTVERFSQRRAAADDAKRVEGVDEVDDELKVDLRAGDRRDDDEIRGVALRALIWDTDVPSDSVDVKVDGGWITLKGDVGYQFESDAAYADVASLYGVYGVTNEIKVNEPLQLELAWAATAAPRTVRPLATPAAAIDHVDWSAEVRPVAVSQRPMARPTAPITIRITPTVAMSIPAAVVVTANLRIAPRAIANRLIAMVMRASRRSDRPARDPVSTSSPYWAGIR